MSHERNTITITPQEGMAAFIVQITDEHHYASRLFLSVEQAQRLLGALGEALDHYFDDQMRWM